MRTRIAGVVISIIVLIGSVSLLQWHGIMFWTEKVGGHGWAWSLLLEATALWLWYKPSIGFRTLALVASILTLAGPVYQVSKPSIQAYYSVADQTLGKEASLDALNSEREQLKKQLDVYQANSLNRTGWLVPIEQANARLIEVNQKIVELTGTADQKTQWFFNWEIAMEVIALVLFQLVAVLSITTISRQVRALISDNAETETGAVSMETSSGNAMEIVMETPISMKTTTMTKFNKKRYVSSPCDGNAIKETEGNATETVSHNSDAEAFVWKPEETKIMETETKQNDAVETEIDEDQPPLDPVLVLADMERFVEKTGKTYKDFAELSGVSPKELSFLRNHEKRLAMGERTVSIPALERIHAAIQ